MVEMAWYTHPILTLLQAIDDSDWVKGIVLRVRKEFKLLFAMGLLKTAKSLEVNEMFERAETTLCLVISLDGKITTGSTDNLDSDSDWKRIVGVKEGFAQYYKVEQTLRPNYLKLWPCIGKGRIQ